MVDLAQSILSLVSVSEIATVLRIDPYVAKIIFTEAKRFCKEKTVMAKATMITTSAPLI
jgi:hypothetical protein